MRVKFGYNKDGSVNQEVIETLKIVKDLVDTKAVSLREGADFVTAQTGLSISHTGLKKVLDRGFNAEGLSNSS